MLRVLIPLLVLAGCVAGADLRSLADPDDARRRAAVEVAVKTAYPAILAEIEGGGGPGLDAAFEAGGVPEAEREARRLQLGGDLALYGANPGALAAAIALYGV